MAVASLFCNVCDEDVPYNRVVRDGQTELTCQFCGFVLHVGSDAALVRAECVLLVTGDPSLSKLLSGTLLNSRLAKEVISLGNGLDFIAEFTERLARKIPPDVVVLDLELPQMNGLTAARIMRFIEDQSGSKRLPVLFSSNREADEALKKQLKEFIPATFLDRGSGTDPTEMAERVRQIITRLLKKNTA